MRFFVLQKASIKIIPTQFNRAGANTIDYFSYLIDSKLQLLTFEVNKKVECLFSVICSRFLFHISTQSLFLTFVWHCRLLVGGVTHFVCPSWDTEEVSRGGGGGGLSDEQQQGYMYVCGREGWIKWILHMSWANVTPKPTAEKERNFGMTVFYDPRED